MSRIPKLPVIDIGLRGYARGRPIKNQQDKFAQRSGYSNMEEMLGSAPEEERPSDDILSQLDGIQERMQRENDETIAWMDSSNKTILVINALIDRVEKLEDELDAYKGVPYTKPGAIKDEDLSAQLPDGSGWYEGALSNDAEIETGLDRTGVDDGTPPSSTGTVGAGQAPRAEGAGEAGQVPEMGNGPAPQQVVSD